MHRLLFCLLFLVLDLSSPAWTEGVGCKDLPIHFEDRYAEAAVQDESTFPEPASDIVSRGTLIDLVWEVNSGCLIAESYSGLWGYPNGSLIKSPQLLIRTRERDYYKPRPDGGIGASSMPFAYSVDGQMLVRAMSTGTCCATVIELVDSESDTSIAESEAINRTSFPRLAISDDGQTIIGITDRGTVFGWQRRGNALDLRFKFGDPRPIRNVYDMGFDASNFYPFVWHNDHIYLGQLDGSIQIWEIATGTLVSTWRGHVGALTELVLGPDERWLASGSDDGSIRLWDMSSGVTQQTIQSIENHSAPVRGLVFSPEGQRLIAGDAFGTIRVWDLQPRGEDILYRGDVPLGDLAYSPSGSQLAIAEASGTITVLNAETLETDAQLLGHSGAVNSIDFNMSGSTIASAGNDATIRIWDPSGDQPAVIETVRWPARDIVRHSTHNNPSMFPMNREVEWFLSVAWDGQLRSHDVATGYVHGRAISQTYLESVAVSPNSRLMATGAWDGAIQLYLEQDGQFGGQAISLSGVSSRINALAFSPNSQVLAAASDDGGVYLWDVTTPAIRLIGRLQGEVSGLNDVLFTSDGSRLVAAGQDIWVWDGQTYQDLALLRGHQAQINALALHPDGVTIASASEDGTVRTWSVQGSAERLAVRHFGPLGDQYGFNDDGRLVAATMIGDNFYSWQPETRKDIGLVRSLNSRELNARIEAFALSPDTRYLISIYDFQRGVAMVDIETGFVIPRWLTSSVSSHEFMVAISADGHWIGTRGYNNAIVWDTTVGNPVASHLMSSEETAEIVFVHGGPYLILSDESNTRYEVWDFIDDVVIATLDAVPAATHNRRLYFLDGTLIDSATGNEARWRPNLDPEITWPENGPGAVISPDGRYLAAVSELSWAIWDLQTGNIVADFPVLSGARPTLIAFSPDGERLFATYRGSLVVWHLEELQ